MIGNVKMVHAGKERGVVLVTALVLLLVATILGISITSTSVMEERMASNTRQGGMAFQAAEVALRNGEDLFINGFGAAQTMLTRSNLKTIFASNVGLYSRDQTTEIDSNPVSGAFDPMTPSSWNAANSMQGDPILTTATNAPPPPRFVIEYVGRSEEDDSNLSYSPGSINTSPYAFRITAIGWGQEQDAAGNNIARILTSTYRIKL